MEPARKFRVIVNSKECGTCSGSSPSAVAKKVVKKLCGTSSKTVRFSLKECKRGCERVCGPYQGRMEKLDKPYKRDGKKITHRVVCGKVRKMRGGRDLRVEDFRNEDSTKYKILTIDGILYIFFDNFFVFSEHIPNENFSHVIYINSDGRLVIKVLSENIKGRTYKIIEDKDRITIRDIKDITLKYLKSELFRISRINNNLKKDYKGIFDIFVAELQKREFIEGYQHANINENLNHNI